MAHSLKLDVFETAEAPTGPTLMMPEDIEGLRLAAYEEGYKAGWEDGCRQRLSDADQARERLAALLETLTFGYAEAQASLLAALRPVFAALVETFMPAAAHAALPPLVAEALLKHAARSLEPPLALRVSPERLADVRLALDGLALPPFELIADPALGQAEARLEAGAQQVVIDLGDASAQIARALSDLYQPQTPEEIRHA